MQITDHINIVWYINHCIYIYYFIYIFELVTFAARKEWDLTGGGCCPLKFWQTHAVKFNDSLKVCRTLTKLRTALFKFVKMRENLRTRTFGRTSNWTTLIRGERYGSGSCKSLEPMQLLQPPIATFIGNRWLVEMSLEITNHDCKKGRFMSFHDACGELQRSEGDCNIQPE